MTRRDRAARTRRGPGAAVPLAARFYRLEAFSDIVIGFCLAQLGLNLILPNDGADAARVWGSTTFFVSAFIFIALLWWLHHRTFSNYFVLNTAMIIMNFGMLCALILTLYFFESVVHVAAVGRDPHVFFTLFIVAFAMVYLLLGVMLLVGVVVRRNELPPAELRWGIGQLASILLTLPVAAGTLALSFRSASLGYVAVVLAVALVVVRRAFLPRWLRRVVPNGSSSR